jgi:hypothetical protein
MGAYAHTNMNLLFDSARFKENCFLIANRFLIAKLLPIVTFWPVSRDPGDREIAPIPVHPMNPQALHG